ncbi:MAG: VOC family protein [Chloroflexi bacterium]|nr:VOC family protein [Chloroflexota bacterium]
MIQRVQGVSISVADMEQALQFYTHVLPFEVIADNEVWGESYERLTGVFGARLRVVTLQLGAERIQLVKYLAPPGGRRIPADSRSNDLWFQHIAIVVSDMYAAYATLRQHRAQHVSTAPQTLPETIPAAAGIQAFYFRDPDGHNLELIAFPAGKGDLRWQNKDALFLGIDHTALGIRDTNTSEPVYTRALGLSVAGRSENSGTEQEHLNMVFGARLWITGLQAQSGGMGVEFLHYLAPPGGRAMPGDTRANDLWNWETVLVSDDIVHDGRAATDAGCQMVSAGIVSLPANNPFECQRACIVRDPDGHALRLVEV